MKWAACTLSLLPSYEIQKRSCLEEGALYIRKLAIHPSDMADLGMGNLAEVLYIRLLWPLNPSHDSAISNVTTTLKDLLRNTGREKGNSGKKSTWQLITVLSMRSERALVSTYLSKARSTRCFQASISVELPRLRCGISAAAGDRRCKPILTVKETSTCEGDADKRGCLI